jgi:DNA polymerase I-like protein with 3'-5' exonuclease and polymerase domains
MVSIRSAHYPSRNWVGNDIVYPLWRHRVQENLQQIPSKGVGARLRNYVIPQEGWKFVVADFSNIELRILAEVSKDKNMLAAFASGQDLHSATAVLMFGLPNDDKYDETAREEAVINGRRLGQTWRAVAKTINYGLVYGMSATKLGKTLKIPNEDAKMLMSKYFQTYAGVKSWLDAQRGRLDKFIEARYNRAYSTTLAGRRRWYDIPKEPKLNGFPYLTKQAVKEHDVKMQEYKKQMASVRRQMCNSPVQGSSADITKLALSLWYKRWADCPLMRLCGVVHDELIVEAAPGYAEAAAINLAAVMDDAQHEYLKVVTLPKPKACIGDHWAHD